METVKTVGEVRRELDLDALRLMEGAHAPNNAHEMCVMEAVAFVAGEPWTDSPQCASPVIAAFLRSYNDSVDDDVRQTLKPYIPKLVGSRGTEDVELRRSQMAIDWMVRVHAPAFLRLAKLDEYALALEALPEIVTAADLARAQAPLEAARAASAAASAAAWDAAWDAAWAAARAAAWAAAWDAAWDAARAALKDTVLQIQATVPTLIDHMLSVA